ncbi:phasin family protein [Mycobacterium sp. KBS0706]|uniref:phasin family protein n=1 Tax=Mycobacterium sp. KBS0706 TaxID=2578109 RepID=UPI00110F6F70|nr:phasin family protein [Mycobacterium sp. KBS0706]TSD82935.1 phasin family protein [Mycobacterium sp. KBS0706]
MSKPEPNEGYGFGASVPFPALAPFGAPIAKTFARAGEAYAKAWLEWQEELVGFVSTRLREDLDLRKSIVGQPNLSEAIKLQQDWAIAAVRDYLDEASKLGEIVSRFVRDEASSWSETAQSLLGQSAPQGSAKSPRASVAAE